MYLFYFNMAAAEADITGLKGKIVVLTINIDNRLQCW